MASTDTDTVRIEESYLDDLANLMTEADSAPVAPVTEPRSDPSSHRLPASA